MSKGTLDKFFGTEPPKPKLRCSNPQCGKVLTDKDTVFKLMIKRKENVYCLQCYKAKMHAREDNEESL
jgi:hypothetical protein